MMDKIDCYALSLIKGMGSKSLFNIATNFDSIGDVVAADEKTLKAHIKGSKKASVIEDVKTAYEQFRDAAESMLEDLSGNGINLVSYWEDSYPDYYRLISDAPVFLFLKGNLDLLNQKSIAVVGTRECSQYGSDIARKTASYFASEGFNIVSGLALGIDTAAHEGALEAGGHTTAVLVDIANIFPKNNEELAERILNNNGLLIAENAPNVFSHRGLFVARDRLQSALSLGVFPVETDVKGGTMHTVGFAQEQERLLFCPDVSSVPYEKSFSKIRGINKLLSEGIATVYNKSDYSNLVSQLENHASLLNEKCKQKEHNDTMLL